MSWSFRAVGFTAPLDGVSKIVAEAIRQTTTTTYTRPVGDQKNLEVCLARLAEDVTWFNSPNAILEAEASGHWDDVSNSGNYQYKILVRSDRRKTPYALAGE